MESEAESDCDNLCVDYDAASDVSDGQLVEFEDDEDKFPVDTSIASRGVEILDQLPTFEGDPLKHDSGRYFGIPLDASMLEEDISFHDQVTLLEDTLLEQSTLSAKSTAEGVQSDSDRVKIVHRDEDEGSCCSFPSSRSGWDSDLDESTDSDGGMVVVQSSSEGDCEGPDAKMQEIARERIRKRANKTSDNVFKAYQPPDGSCPLRGVDKELRWKGDRYRKIRKRKWKKITRKGIVRFHHNTPVEDMYLSQIQGAFEVWATNTNKKLAEKAEEKGAKWKPLDQYDIYAYIAQTLWMDTSPRPERSNYWHTDPFIGDTFVKAVSKHSGMTHRRYSTSTYNCRLYDKEEAEKNGWNDPNSSNYVPTFRVKPFIDQMNLAAQREVIPNRDLSLDEEMEKFTGRFRSRQYIPRKPNNTGIKYYAVSDARTPYLFHSQLHHTAEKFPFDAVGAKFGRSWALLNGHGLQGGINFLDEWRCIYMDSYYTSVHLLWELLHRKTYAVGTIEANSLCLPVDLCNKESTILREKQLPRGSVAFRHTVDGKMSFAAWQDKSLVRILYTDPECSEQITLCNRADKEADGGVVTFNCPLIVKEYSLRMGGVDWNDQINATQYRHRRSSFWYHSVHSRPIRVAATNTYALLQMLGIAMPVLDLKRLLAHRFGTLAIRPCPKSPISMYDCIKQPYNHQQSERHNRSIVHPPVFVTNKKRQLCVVHAQKKQWRKTSMKCGACGVFLCKKDDCWTYWHEI